MLERQRDGDGAAKGGSAAGRASNLSALGDSAVGVVAAAGDALGGETSELSEGALAHRGAAMAFAEIAGAFGAALLSDVPAVAASVEDALAGFSSLPLVGATTEQLQVTL